jgi:hypothetical protein
MAITSAEAGLSLPDPSAPAYVPSAFGRQAPARPPVTLGPDPVEPGAYGQWPYYEIDPYSYRHGRAPAFRIDDGSLVVFPGSYFNASTDDGAAINTAMSGTKLVRLVPGLTYSGATPINVPAGVQLYAPNGYRTASGPVWQPTGLATGAAVTFQAGTPAGAVRGLIVDGSLLPAGTVDGFGCYLNAKQGSLIDVHARLMTRHGVNITQSGGNPDGWYVHQISAHDNAGSGVNWDYAVDGQLSEFHLDHNTQHGLAVGTLNNWAALNGRCQQNTLAGYGSTGGFIKASALFSGCGSENNLVSGWDFTGTNGQGTITFSGCWSRDDGTSGTSGSGYSGFNMGGLGNNLVKIFQGCITYVTTASAGPDYGISLTSDKGWLIIEGGKFVGSVAGHHDGGGNTVSQQAVSNSLSCIGAEGALTSMVLKNAWP